MRLLETALQADRPRQLRQGLGLGAVLGDLSQVCAKAGLARGGIGEIPERVECGRRGRAFGRRGRSYQGRVSPV